MLDVDVDVAVVVVLVVKPATGEVWGRVNVEPLTAISVHTLALYKKTRSVLPAGTDMNLTCIGASFGDSFALESMRSTLRTKAIEASDATAEGLAIPSLTKASSMGSSTVVMVYLVLSPQLNTSTSVCVLGHLNKVLVEEPTVKMCRSSTVPSQNAFAFT